MGKPRMIILIRHAQSEGNKNRAIHQTVPDHRVKLTSDGWRQAAEAGVKLRSLLHPDDTLHFFTSPYRRTRETTEGILEALTADDPSPSPFQRRGIKVYEEPRLREQDFGNFQPSSADMERMWRERAEDGHFFYRIPNGESAADAYDRISGFNESLWRQFGERDCASVCVLVTHGLMTRVFLMKWYHFSVEYFEDLRNIDHCEFVIMMKNEDSGKYILQNKLRTWSELRREREIAAGCSPTSTRRDTHIPQWRWLERPSAADKLDTRQGASGPVDDKNDHVPAQSPLDRRRRSLSFNHEAPVATDPLTFVTPSTPVGAEATSTGDRHVTSEADSHTHLSLHDRTHTYHSGRDFGGSMSGAASPVSGGEGEGYGTTRRGGAKSSAGGEANAREPSKVVTRDSDPLVQQQPRTKHSKQDGVRRELGVVDEDDKDDDTDDDDDDDDEEEEEEVHGMDPGAQADALGDHKQDDAFPLSLRGGGGAGFLGIDSALTQDDRKVEEELDAPLNEADRLKAEEKWDRSIQGSVY